MGCGLGLRLDGFTWELPPVTAEVVSYWLNGLGSDLLVLTFGLPVECT